MRRGGSPAPSFGRLGGCESGAALLEFAFILPVLIALCAGCVELGRALLTYSAIETAVRGGARSLAQAPDPTCDPVCSWGANRAMALAREQIIANTGLPAAAIRVAPVPDPPPGIVVLRAEVDVGVAFLGLFGRRDAWTAIVSRQEARIAD